jgi:hypothetical protein
MTNICAGPIYCGHWEGGGDIFQMVGTPFPDKDVVRARGGVSPYSSNGYGPPHACHTLVRFNLASFRSNLGSPRYISRFDECIKNILMENLMGRERGHELWSVLTLNPDYARLRVTPLGIARN